MLDPAPNRGSRWRSASPAWVVRSGQPGTVTRPPVTTAAARNGAALDRSGSIAQPPDVERPRLDPPGVRRRRARRCAPAARSIATVMSMCGAGRQPRRRRAAPRRASAQRGAGEQQRADELRRHATRRGVTLPPSSQPRPCTVSGQPVVGGGDRRPRGRAAPRTTGASGRCAGPRVAVEPHVAGRRAPPPAAGSASRCRRCRRPPTPGRPAAPGLTCHRPRRLVDHRAHGAQPGGHQRGVAADQRVDQGRWASGPGRPAPAPGWSATWTRAGAPWRARERRRTAPATGRPWPRA